MQIKALQQYTFRKDHEINAYVLLNIDFSTNIDRYKKILVNCLILVHYYIKKLKSSLFL